LVLALPSPLDDQPLGHHPPSLISTGRASKRRAMLISARVRGLLGPFEQLAKAHPELGGGRRAAPGLRRSLPEIRQSAPIVGRAVICADRRTCMPQTRD
jgi:hypothetical protein